MKQTQVRNLCLNQFVAHCGLEVNDRISLKVSENRASEDMLMSLPQRPGVMTHSPFDPIYEEAVCVYEELEGPAVSARCAIAEVKQRWSVTDRVTKNSLSSEVTLSRWSRLDSQSSASTNPHWARVVGYGPL
jgi:hypothetical protein